MRNLRDSEYDIFKWNEQYFRPSKLPALNIRNFNYNFFTSEFKNNVDYKTYLNFFKDIGHINLIKVNDLTNKNTPNGIYRYFFEIEIIEPSTNENTSFAYYYGFIYLKN